MARLSLRNRLWCWWFQICTKHGIGKELVGYDPMSAYMECPECRTEKEQKFARKHAEILRLLEVGDEPKQ